MERELALLTKKLLSAGRMKSSNNEYAKLQSDAERFAYTMDLMDEYEIRPNIELEVKNKATSECHRKAGNELFVSLKANESMNKILELYTMSVAYAESKTPEAALAYSNRSALLFNVGLYDHCLLDIDRALSSNYPQHIKAKLLIRRVNCLKACGDKPEGQVVEAIEEASGYIERLHLGDAKQATEKNKILKNTFKPQRKLFDEEKYKPLAPDDNPEIPGVSAALKIAHNEQFGRHIVATRRILPGEVLSVQHGYATILAPEHFHSHCSNCLRQTWSAVPCERCPSAVYCNESCRDKAWKDHHDVECGLVGVLLKLEFNLLGLMSLRLAIRAVREAGSFESLKNKLESTESWPDPRTKGFTGKPLIFDENDYSSTYTLARNTENRSTPDLFGRSFNAAFILYCLATMTDFLGKKFPPSPKAIRSDPWVIFLGGLVTRHQQIIPSNVHAVTETFGLNDRERGASLIPFLSLFNHSCDDMLERIHYGRYVVQYALQPIEAGKQVYDNYGAHYAMQDRHSRQAKLQRQFFFNCECRPCTEDWPLFLEIPSWREQESATRRHKRVLNGALKNFPKYMVLATDGNIEDKLYIIKDLKRMIIVLFDHVDLPCRELNEVVETLKRIYALLSTRYQSLSD